jgi:hypothetical protein
VKHPACDDPPEITLRLPLDGATAAVLIDLCGQLEEALLRQWGDEIEAHWLATDPGQPIYGPLRPPSRR